MRQTRLLLAGAGWSWWSIAGVSASDRVDGVACVGESITGAVSWALSTSRM